MAKPAYFSRHIVLTGSILFGVLARTRHPHHHPALRSQSRRSVEIECSGADPARAALAWWLIAAVAFLAGYITASLMHSAVSRPDSAADAAIPDRGRRHHADGRRTGGLRAESDPDVVRGSGRRRSAVSWSRDVVLRRAICAAPGLIQRTEKPRRIERRGFLPHLQLNERTEAAD